jgi:hypothetical protein
MPAARREQQHYIDQLEIETRVASCPRSGAGCDPVCLRSLYAGLLFMRSARALIGA